MGRDVGRDMSESEFQIAVIDLAHTFGWVCAHFRAAQNRRGVWMTPVAADGAGWPDLALFHEGQSRVLYRELKSATGKLSAAQQEWGRVMLGCGQDWCVWRPADMSEIAATLSQGRAVAL